MKAVSNKHPIKQVSPLFQLVCVIISVLLIAFMINKRLTEFRVRERQPAIIRISPKNLTEFGGFLNTVRVGLYIDKFQAFDVVNNLFIFTGILWFQFSAGAISLDTLEKFNFEWATIRDRSKPSVQLVDDKTLVRYNIRVEFMSMLDYTYFPFDDHRLYLVLTNKFVSPREVIFESFQRSFIVKPEADIFGWNQINSSVKTGYAEAKIDPHDERKTLFYPLVIFSIDYARYGIRFLLSILLPLLLIFYLVMFSFSLDKKPGIGLAIGGVTAILGYRFVIERLSPPAGYFMISDYIFFLLLIVSCLIFFINVFDHYLMPLTLNKKKNIVVILHAFVISLCGYFFFMLI